MLNASVVGTVKTIKLVVISIPDTGDFTGLDRALAVLRNSPAIALVVEDVALGPAMPAPHAPR